MTVELERTDPAVAAAAKGYDEMRDKIIAAGACSECGALPDDATNCGEARPGGRVHSGAPTPADQLAALSRWIDEASANAQRDREAALWGRVAKVGEEHGEVIAALIGATGQNPRKGVTHAMDDVVEELLDTALTALCAVEHMTENRGFAMEMLARKVDRVHARAGLGVDHV